MTRLLAYLRRPAFLLGLLLACGLIAAPAVAEHVQFGPDGLSDHDRSEFEDDKRRKAEERERRRNDPEERAERERSRTAHEDEKLNSGKAADLVSESFGEETLESPGDEPLAGANERIDRFLSDHAALLESDGGEKRIVESPLLPLRSEEGQELDLELDEDAEAFSPREGGAEVRLRKQVRDGIVFGDSGVRLRPLETRDSAPEARKRGEGVVWPKAWRDADLFAVPSPAGASLNVSLRSERSAERYEFEAELPDGARLKALDDGDRGVLVEDRDGKTLAELSPPLARDSDGEPVETRMRVEGERIVLRIDHRGASSPRYPILLDPLYTDYKWYEGTDTSNPNQNWVHYATNDNRFSFSIAAQNGACYNNDGRNPTCRGLYVFSNGNTNYSAGEYGRWYWNAPNSTTYLERFDAQAMALDHRGESSPRPDLRIGIVDPATNRWTGFRGYPNSLWASSESVTPGTNITGVDARLGRRAVFEVFFDDPGHRDNRVHAYLGGARLHMNDPEAPTLGALTHATEAFPTGWTNKTFPSLTVAASDPGLGMKSIFLRRPGGDESEVRHGCAGTRQDTCPASWSASFDYRSAEQQEGVHQFETRALDALGKQSPVRPHQLKIDHTAPDLTSSGTLKDAERQTFRTDRVLNLRSEARDQSALGPRAGVGSLEIAVSGTVRSPTSTCNTDSCSVTRDFSLDTATLPEGEHRVRVTATDRAGNAKVETHTFSIDRPGEYLVKACDDDAPGGASNAWVVRPPGGGTAASKDCPSNGNERRGLYTRTTDTTVARGGAYIRFDAAPNTRLRSLDAALKVVTKGAEPGTFGVGVQSDGVRRFGCENGQCLGTVSGAGGPSAERKRIDLAQALNVEVFTRCVTGGASCGFAGSDNDIFASLYGATVTVLDPELPVITPRSGVLVAPKWSRARADADLVADATDNTGVSDLSMAVDGGPADRKSFPCDYTKAKPCESRPGERFTYDTRTLLEGEHALRLETEDASGHQVEIDRQFGIDNTAPRALRSGSLHFADGRWSRRGDFKLRVDARDMSRLGPRAGVRSIQTRVNDAPAFRHNETAPAGCADSCALDRTLQFADADFKVGRNKVELIVTDNAGNEYRHVYADVRLDRVPATKPVLSGPLWERRNQTFAPGSGALRVEARDGVAGDGNSGVHSIEVLVDGRRADIARQECTEGSCPMSHHWTFDPARYGAGRHTVRVLARDGAGDPAGEESFSFTVEGHPPGLELSGSLYEAKDQTLLAGTYDLKALARDCDPPAPGASAPPNAGVKSALITLSHNGGAPEEKSFETRARYNGPAACRMLRTWVFRPDAYENGTYRVEVTATDFSDNETKQAFAFSLGALRQAEPQSGGGLEEWFDFESEETGAGTRAHVNRATGNFVWHSTPIVNPGRGLSSFVNLTYNAQARKDDPKLREVPAGLPSLEAGELKGDLDTQELSMRYQEAGQGFSIGATGLTRLNEPLDVSRALAGALPGQVGVIGGPIHLTDPDGTRHEFRPSGNDENDDGYADYWMPPPGVQLHLRKWSKAKPNDLLETAAQVLSEASARVADLGIDASKVSEEVKLGLLRALLEELEDPKKTWAATRPDGVTYFFDRNGYQTSIEDRNGNEIRFEYEYGGITGETCSLLDSKGGVPDLLSVDDAACAYKLRRIVDPAGVDALKAGNEAGARERSIEFEYCSEVPGALPGGPAPSGPDKDKCPEGLFDLHLPLPPVVDGVSKKLPQGTPSGAAPKPSGPVLRITDHADRKTAFDYDKEGYLEKLTQADGEDAKRSFGFEYEQRTTNEDAALSDDPLARFEPLYMKKVIDPRGATTEVDYEGRDTQPLPPADNPEAGLDPAALALNDEVFFGRRAQQVTDRRGHERDLNYNTQGEGPGRSYETTVTDARDEVWRYKLDRRARLREMEDPRGVRMELGWDDHIQNDNNVVSLTQAADSPDASTTSMAYNQNGLLTESTEAYDTDDARTTEMTYRDGRGTLVSPRGEEEGGRFVSDPLTVTSPEGADSWDGDDYKTTFEPDAKGNVLSRTARGGADDERYVARTAYDGNGLVIREEDYVRDGSDEKADVTTFEQHDPNGLSKLVTDPRGNASLADADDGLWRYTYDEVGNVLTKADPRRTSGNAFTTRLTYDDLDRLLKEEVPKDSTNGDFITRERRFDENGNEVWSQDGEGAETDTTYSATDRPVRIESPATGHHGETGSAREVTTLEYDEEENLVEQTTPNGSRTDTEDDYSTEFRYDEVGQRVAELRRSRVEGDSTDLATSWSYDGRGNVNGMVDPRRNAEFGGEPEENASEPERRRLTYEYDKADNRRFVKEDTEVGAESGERLLTAETEYDLNDNVVAEIDPRGAESGDKDRFRTEMEYDERDLLIAETDPLGGRSEFERRPNGQLSAQTSPRGTTTSDPDDFRVKFTYYPTRELKSRTLPEAEDQYGPEGEETIEYTRDAVGNPIEIKDARDHTFTNTFYDTGDLRTSTRPSWWGYEPSARPGRSPGEAESAHEVSEKGPTPNDGAKPDMGQKPNSPDAAARRQSGSSIGAGKQGGHAEARGDFGAVEPEPMPDLMPKAGETSFAYDDEMRLERVTDTAGAYTEIGHDAVGRLTSLKRPLTVTQDVTNVTDDDFILTTQEYDRNGNVRESVDGEGWRTVTKYDQFDRPIEQVAPGSDLVPTDDDPEGHKPGEPLPADELSTSQGSFADRVTRLTYDENDNPVRVESPRGPEFAEERTFDGRDLLVAETNPQGETTAYGYDAADNQTCKRSPRGTLAVGADADCQPVEGGRPVQHRFDAYTEYDAKDQVTAIRPELDQDNAENPTTFEYDVNGNQTKEIAPGAQHKPGAGTAPQTTERTFDGRDLPWTESTGSGTDEQTKRTTITEFDSNGNLRRTVKPRGVKEDATPQWKDDGDGVGPTSDKPRHATVREYSDDDLLEAIHQPFGKANENSEPKDKEDGLDRRRYRQDFKLDPRGRVEAMDAPYEWSAEKPGGVKDDDKWGGTSTYTHFDTGWIRTAKDPELTDPKGPDGKHNYKQTLRYGYDKRGLQTSWRATGGNTCENREDKQADRRSVTRGFYPSGELATRQGTKPTDGKDCSDEKADQTTTRSYDYFYNPNGSRTEMIDLPDGKRPGQPGYDASKLRTTLFDYDRAERQTLVNERWRSGKDSVMRYDPDGNVTERQTDASLVQGASPPGLDPAKRKLNTYLYDPRGLETKSTVDPQKGGDRVTTSDYWPSGELEKRTKSNGSTERSFFFDDGRPSRKIRTKKGAEEGEEGPEKKNQRYAYDDDGNRTEDERGTYTHNARDQLTSWTRGEKAPRGKPDAENPEGKDMANTKVSYEMNGAGQVTREDDDGKVTDYTYLGDRLTNAISDEGVPDKEVKSDYSYDAFGSMTEISSDPTLESGTTQTTSFEHDEFQRMTKATGPGQEPGEFTYDGLDRRDTKKEKGKTLDMSYVGDSEMLSREEDGTQTRFFDYSATFERLGQATESPSQTGPAYKTYEKDVNGSAEGLEDEAELRAARSTPLGRGRADYGGQGRRPTSATRGRSGRQ